MAKRVATYCSMLLLLMMNCVEPFDMPVRNEDVGFLVVDGYINTKNQTATVVLTRAIPLAAGGAAPREFNASVFIEEEGGRTYTLQSENNGVYRVTSSDFLNDRRYRLRIMTASRKEYYSEYITTKRSPEIDSVSWSPSLEGVTINIDTYDPLNQTKYYRWEYEETWKYESPQSSEDKLVNGVPVYRQIHEKMKNV
jgi:hypothetical protein